MSEVTLYIHTKSMLHSASNVSPVEHCADNTDIVDAVLKLIGSQPECGAFKPAVLTRAGRTCTGVPRSHPPPPPKTLPQASAQGSRGVLGGVGVFSWVRYPCGVLGGLLRETRAKKHHSPL